MYKYFILLILSQVRADNAPVVTTAKGNIRGVRSEDGNYNMFLGIPYAKVDETNPFGTSIPYPPFEKVFEANDDSSQCPQIERYNLTFIGDIDCLRLNIYTPTYVTTTSRLPVLVYIFGGALAFGSYSRSQYGPKYLVRHDIILVVINYRVGPYGFMCLDIPEVPGNQGLKDQIMAFRWIKSHITAFGGDPDRVTICGHSAGASAVNYHIHRDNNLEKLYNKAIIQSGFEYDIERPILKDAPIVLARYYQFITDNVYQAIAFLATLPPRDIIVAESMLGLHINKPCLEKKFPGIESYATVEWFEQKPTTASMSFLIGNTDDEKGVEGRHPFSLGEAQQSNIIGTYFDTQHEDYQGLSELVERFYVVDNSFVSVGKLYTDMACLYQSYCYMREFIENDAAAVYIYNFTYVGKRNYYHITRKMSWPRAYHADEIGYLFEMAMLPEEPTSADQLVIDKITTLWANFVKYGNPTPEISELIDVEWKPVTPTTPFYCLNIDSNLTLTISSFADKVAFWDLFYKQNSNLRRRYTINDHGM